VLRPRPGRRHDRPERMLLPAPRHQSARRPGDQPERVLQRELHDHVATGQLRGVGLLLHHHGVRQQGRDRGPVREHLRAGAYRRGQHLGDGRNR